MKWIKDNFHVGDGHSFHGGSFEVYNRVVLYPDTDEYYNYYINKFYEFKKLNTK